MVALVGVGVGVAAESSRFDTFRSRPNEPVLSSFFVVASSVYVPADSAADMREFKSKSAPSLWLSFSSSTFLSGAYARSPSMR